MEQFLKIIFYLSFIGIIHTMITYPISMIVLDKIVKRDVKKDYMLTPRVTILVVAHNEEKSIKKKLLNIFDLDYPKEKLEVIVASDNSSDKTNEIVKKIICQNNSKIPIQLYEVKNRKGKTNAQNEAMKIVKSDFVVFTDANSIIHKSAVKELMSSFVSPDICYVTGRLVYYQNLSSLANQAETTYWDLDLKIREIESKIQTITAGNGALYACRKKDYIDIPLMESHDSTFPIYFALKEKRAIANHNAIAYEKTGEKVVDEYERKVRMNRVLLKMILPDIKILNFLKYKFFSYFYISHRTLRYLLWFNHILVFFSNLFLRHIVFYKITFFLQLLFFIIAILSYFKILSNKYSNLIYYYAMTILAQFHGIYNSLTGKNKPFWDSVESTR